MSDERFELAYEQGNWWAVRDGDITLWKEEVVDLLNEQQATIRRLQDLCGESDGENAKLRIENKRLEEENEQLRQIMNDIVVATDETYTKNASVFKVTVVLDFEKYMEIRRCIE